MGGNEDRKVRVLINRVPICRGAFVPITRALDMAKNSTKPPILVAFGQIVREQRKAKGYSQEAFADVCEIDRSYMGGVERGERNLALLNIERIIAALEIKPSLFFKELDEHWFKPLK